MDNYERLRVILDKNPAGAPPSKSFDEILRILFTREEVQVAVTMTFSPKSVENIADKAGFDTETTQQLCESMANKGIVFSREKNGETRYSLLPTIPGIFEFPFMTGGGTPMHDRLGKLWEEYHYETQGYDFGSSPTPLTRVMPVEESLQERSEVLPYEVLSKMMENTRTFAVAGCACRISAGENSCDKPRDVCLIFDSAADFLIQRNLAKEISIDEAKKVLKRSEEEGLVHISNNSQDRLNLICNCCPCCCTILTGLTKIKSPHPFACGRWYAVADESTCSGCGICSEERCPVEAINLEGGIAIINQETCIGCGLCVTECPEQSISMVLRDNAVSPPATVLEMGANVLMEKGRLEEFMALNNS